MKAEKMGASPMSNVIGNESVSKRPTTHVSHHAHNFCWMKCRVKCIYTFSSALATATNHQYYHLVVAFIFCVLHLSRHTSSSGTQFRMLLSSILQVWKHRDQIIRVSGFCAILMMHWFPWPYHEGCFNVYITKHSIQDSYKGRMICSPFRNISRLELSIELKELI